MLFNHFLPKSFLLFSPDAESGGDPNAADNSSNNQDNDTPTDGGSGSDTATTGKTFTQDDVNKFVGDARQQARTKATTDLLADLDFEDADALKTFIVEKRKSDLDSMDENERLKKQLADSTIKKEELTKLKDQVEKQNAAITKLVDELVKELNIPKYVLEAIEGRSALEQLEYLTANRSSFVKQTPPDIDATTKSNGKKKPDKKEREKQLSARFNPRG